MADNYLKRLGLVLALVMLVAGHAVHAQDEGDQERSLTHGGEERTYWVHVPPEYDGAEATPLVITLHGATMSGLSMMLMADFDALADEIGAIAVYPNAIGGRWSYFDKRDLAPGADFHDDVGFITTLVDRLSDTYAIDPNRIYVAGYSNGGRLALRLRCEMADRLAGVAVIAATLSFEMVDYCMASGPTPTLVVLGTKDPAFPMLGYAIITPEGQFESLFSINQVMTFLTTLNGCERDLTSEDVSSPHSTLAVTRHTYEVCPDGANVMLYSLIDGGHEWPGQIPVMLDEEHQGTIRDAIWQFFMAHSLDR